VLALCGLALGLSIGSVSATGARSASSTLDITYTSAKSLQVKLSDGTVAGSGTLVPAGTYMVLVYDDPGTDPNPKLTINGPGVAVSSDLNSTGMGIDQPATLGPYTFQTSSSYTVEDTTIGASSLITFTTTATSGTSGGTTSTVPSGSTGSGQTTTTTATTTTTPASKKVKPLGTLKGSVSASGKPTLTFGGKTLKSLKAGLYSVSVADHSKKAGLILGQSSKHAITLSGAAAVGTSVRTVTLSAGKSFFEASTSGPKTYFSVIK
jgi:hypothetical protein